MCGRFTLDIDARFYPRFNLSDKYIIFFEPQYNIAPGQDSLIILRDEDINFAKPARFGFIPSWAKDERIAYKMINAKAETVLEKPSFKKAIIETRCLIPVTGFYEWHTNDDGSKSPYYFHNPQQKYLALAGIYSTWQDKETFSIITTEPNSSVKDIHNRMPLILDLDDESMWLNHEVDIRQLQAILANPVTTKLESYQVSKKVNYAEHNSPDLISKV